MGTWGSFIFIVVLLHLSAGRLSLLLVIDTQYFCELFAVRVRFSFHVLRIWWMNAVERLDMRACVPQVSEAGDLNGDYTSSVGADDTVTYSSTGIK